MSTQVVGNDSTSLGQLAVDRHYQGNGFATSLMYFALTTAVQFSRSVGCFGVLTHPLDDGVRAFYRRFGFEALPYVNKDAPKGGRVVYAIQGSFDSVNPFIVKGAPAAGVNTLVFDPLMRGP